MPGCLTLSSGECAPAARGGEEGSHQASSQNVYHSEGTTFSQSISKLRQRSFGGQIVRLRSLVLLAVTKRPRLRSSRRHSGCETDSTNGLNLARHRLRLEPTYQDVNPAKTQTGTPTQAETRLGFRPMVLNSSYSPCVRTHQGSNSLCLHAEGIQRETK